MFYDPNLLEKLNDNYIFVALNASSTHGQRRDGIHHSWMNFHSDYSRQNDYKLRYALMGTPYWGSYITDIIKNCPEVDSGKLKKHLNAHPEKVTESIKLFKEELSLINNNAILIALGNDSYELLQKYFGRTNKIIKIKHYSFTIGKEDYRKDVLDQLDDLS